MNKSVLVVAAHSDDEALGCGGTIARLVSDSYQVSIAFMTNGVGARPSHEDASKERLICAGNALKKLGVENFTNYDFPDNQLDTIPMLDLVKVIEQEILQSRPSIVVSHHAGDLNTDHRRVAEAVMVATRPQPDQSVKEIWSFEVLSSTEWAFSNYEKFSPNLFIDITDQIDVKLAACSEYTEEFREPPHTRSYDHVRSLAAHRGNTVGVGYAEAFQIIRKTI